MRHVWNTHGVCKTPGALPSGKNGRTRGTETHPQAELLKAICPPQVHLKDFSTAKIVLRASHRIVTSQKKML